SKASSRTAKMSVGRPNGARNSARAYRARPASSTTVAPTEASAAPQNREVRSKIPNTGDGLNDEGAQAHTQAERNLPPSPHRVRPAPQKRSSGEVNPVEGMALHDDLLAEVMMDTQSQLPSFMHPLKPPTHRPRQWRDDIRA